MGRIRKPVQLFPVEHPQPKIVELIILFDGVDELPELHRREHAKRPIERSKRIVVVNWHDHAGADRFSDLPEIDVVRLGSRETQEDDICRDSRILQHTPFSAGARVVQDREVTGALTLSDMTAVLDEDRVHLAGSVIPQPQWGHDRLIDRAGQWHLPRQCESMMAGHECDLEVAVLKHSAIKAHVLLGIVHACRRHPRTAGNVERAGGARDPSVTAHRERGRIHQVVMMTVADEHSLDLRVPVDLAEPLDPAFNGALICAQRAEQGRRKTRACHVRIDQDGGLAVRDVK